MSNTEYDPSGNSNLSFHVGADILNLLLLYKLYVFPRVINAKTDKATIFSSILRSNLLVSFNIKTCGLGLLLFCEFINVVFIVYTLQSNLCPLDT